jgi:hypothetical protein
VNFKTWLFGYPTHSPDQERIELVQLQVEVRKAVAGTLLERSPEDLIFAITKTILEDAGCTTPPADIERRVHGIVAALFREELLFRIVDYDRLNDLDLSGAVAIRKHLRVQRVFLERSDSVIDAWRGVVSRLLVPIIRELPPAVMQASEPRDELQAPLITFTQSPAQLVENIYFEALYGGTPEIEEFGLFSSLKHRLNRNIEAASGIIPGRSSTKPLVFPTSAKGKSPTELVPVIRHGIRTPFLG